MKEASHEVISILTKLDVSLNFNLDRYIHFHIVTPEWSSRRAESQPQSQPHFSSDRLDASFDFTIDTFFFEFKNEHIFFFSVYGLTSGMSYVFMCGGDTKDITT